MTSFDEETFAGKFALWKNTQNAYQINETPEQKNTKNHKKCCPT